jgi:transposase
MDTNSYPSDLTDGQWEIIKPMVMPPEGKKREQGRPPTVDRRRILNAISYILRSGCQYRMPPHDFPPWQTVDYYLRKWRKDGTPERSHDALRDQVRSLAKRWRLVRFAATAAKPLCRESPGCRIYGR